MARNYALFGGSPGNATGALGDTWTLNADTGQWQQLAGTGPGARAGASLAFDGSAGRVVLFGGTGLIDANLSDAWELDSAARTWSALPTSVGPIATTGAVLGFDPQASRITVAAGLNYSSSGGLTPQSSTVWSLDRAGQRWTDRSAELAPPMLRRGAVFDAARQSILALGSKPPPTRALMWSFDPRGSAWTAQDITDVAAPFGVGEFDQLPSGTNGLFYAPSLARTIEVVQGGLVEWDGQHWSARCSFASSFNASDLVDTAVAYDAASNRAYLYAGVHALTLGAPYDAKVYRVDVDTCAAETLLASGGASARSHAVATWDSDRQRLIVFGGSRFSGADLVPVTDASELDPVGLTWTPIATPGPAAREDATSVYDPIRHRVVLHGGRGAAGRLYDTWELDPSAQSWQQLNTTGPSEPEEAALTFDGVRSAPALVSTGGAVWHLSSGSWVADLNPTTPSARSGLSGGYCSVSGIGLFFGGTSGDGQRDFLGDLWTWRDGWHGVYSGTGTSLLNYGQGSPSTGIGYGVPAGRTGHVLATGLVDTRPVTPQDVVLLFGGEGASDQYLGLFGDTWTLDVETLGWAQVATSTSPRGRTGHAMTVFPSRGYLLFGGLGRDRFHTSGSQDQLRDTYFSDTWIWALDGGWKQLATDGPSARYGHAMATDQSTNEVILFGGRDATGVSSETWRLNLASTTNTAVWQKLSPATTPLPRFGHTMTWDPVRHRIVLTGGEGASASQTFQDTWEWDSTNQNWVLRNIQPLEGRAGHVAFFDAKRSELLTFGGFAHREAGQYAVTFGDTLAFLRAGDTDPPIGFPNGTRCTKGSDCGSGTCADGYCCNSTCTGQCGACDVAGSEGTCTAVLGAPHAGRASCGSSTGECSTQCNGVDMTQCNAPPSGTTCGPSPGCFGDNTLITAKGTCNTSGSCASPQVSCGAFICCDGVRCIGPAKCVTNCQGADELCAIGFKCNSPGGDPFGQCYKATKITSFTATPATAKVGVAMTFSVTATEPTSRFQFSYHIGTNNPVFPNCSGSTCSWTPASTDAGQAAKWTVAAGAAPHVISYNDDSQTMTLTVQP